MYEEGEPIGDKRTHQRTERKIHKKDSTTPPFSPILFEDSVVGVVSNSNNHSHKYNESIDPEMSEVQDTRLGLVNRFLEFAFVNLTVPS